MPTYDRIHLASCLADAVRSAVENLRDDAAVSHLTFHRVIDGGEYRGDTLYSIAYTYLEDGLVNCTCGAINRNGVSLDEVSGNKPASSSRLTSDCSWFDVRPQARPWWARVICLGDATEIDGGLLCEAHRAAFDSIGISISTVVEDEAASSSSTEDCTSIWHKVDEGKPINPCPTCGSVKGV